MAVIFQMDKNEKQHSTNSHNLPDRAEKRWKELYG